MRAGVTIMEAKTGATFLHRLGRDTSGNTLALMAAALLPLLGMIGGGIDMSRAYLAHSRLQQACDAGVLAARKQLGSQVAVDGIVPDEVAVIGDRFFNLNFRDGSYGTEDREFQLFLEGDNSLTGEASVTVPTAVMNVFGFDEVSIDVECGAVLSFQNLDLMMVLDTTGSMRHTNAGDTMSRMESMKQVIRDFHAEIEGNKAPGVRVRYGFVPYATNVNVGHLLKDEWVVQDWTYQSRVDTDDYVFTSPGFSILNRVVISGTYTDWTTDYTYATADGACNEPLPPPTYTWNETVISTTTTPFAGPPAGTQTHEEMEAIQNGVRYRVIFNGTECEVQKEVFDNQKLSYTRWTRPYEFRYPQWIYKPVLSDVSNWRTETPGCIEERSTYEIDDFDNIDLNRALDLDLDLVPEAGNADTQWRPQYREKIFVRSMYWDGSGAITPEEVTSTNWFADTGNWWFSGCPAPAQKLTPMDSNALNTYLDTLVPDSATYHDIGMIWGGRLLSPTGIFSSQNQDVSATKPTNRNLIFLTDGQTEPYDLAYGAYGVDALDQRRWNQGSALTLTETVEQRFLAACKEVKKKNITVWVIAFGTDLNPAMTECAGSGRYFEADDAAQLSSAFQAIAASLGDLRISQ